METTPQYTHIIAGIKLLENDFEKLKSSLRKGSHVKTLQYANLVNESAAELNRLIKNLTSKQTFIWKK